MCFLINHEGRRTGRLFHCKLNPPKLCEFEDDFLTLLENVQTNTNLINKELDIREVAGIHRTIWRGLTNHVINMGIDDKLLRRINRWHDEVKGTDSSRVDMIETYSDLDKLTPGLLQFSRRL